MPGTRRHFLDFLRVCPSNTDICQSMTRIAAIQMTSGADVATNLKQAAELIASAVGRGATLVVLPENFASMPVRDADRLDIAETFGDGPIQEFLADSAQQNKCCLVGGTIPVRSATADRLRAACLVYDESGRLVARYDKMHLFDVAVPGRDEEYRESVHIEPGSDVVAIDTPAGRLGLAVCYDVRFPELFRALAADGSQLIALPAAFTVATGAAHWEVLVRARAIENLSYVIAACQEGQHPGGRQTWGDSMIVDPWGGVLARRPKGPGIITADLDTARQRATRRDFPALQHRRLS